MICRYPENGILPFFMPNGPDSGQRPFPGDRPPPFAWRVSRSLSPSLYAREGPEPPHQQKKDAPQ